MTLYRSVVFLHLLAAFVWLGGLLFLALVGAPVLRKVEPPELRVGLFRAMGLRFRWVGWSALGVLLGTGVAILHLRGVLRWELLSHGAWWSTPFGTALKWKLLAVGVMVTAGAWHDFVEGPRAARESRGKMDRAGPSTARRWSIILARGSVLVGLVLIYWAMRMVRG
ncbi:MAG: DUF4149 domain-containing protein [Gemmatimonadota bacterium]